MSLPTQPQSDPIRSGGEGSVPKVGSHCRWDTCFSAKSRCGLPALMIAGSGDLLFDELVFFFFFLQNFESVTWWQTSDGEEEIDFVHPPHFNGSIS